MYGICGMKKPTTREWMAASFAVGLAIVLIARGVAAPGEKVTMALRASARWSFLLFWLATSGSALVTLYGSRFQALARQARNLGLAFASAHLAHLGVVVWIYFSSSSPPERSTLIFFGIAVICTYTLAIFSIKRLSAALNPRLLRAIRIVGVEYIALAFLVDFDKNPFQGGFANFIAYVPFLALAIAGPVLRLAALAKRLSQVRRLAI
jgi:D-alanyl-lipoteichoic acid acyltransferase DltB (MBOAT superfamily)